MLPRLDRHNRAFGRAAMEVDLVESSFLEKKAITSGLNLFEMKASVGIGVGRVITTLRLIFAGEV